MGGRTTLSWRLGVAALIAFLGLLVFAAYAPRARAATSCGVVTASGHPWIVVAKGITCPSATQVVRALAARTAALHAGASVTVRSPLAGFTCLLASRGKPGGSCSTPRVTKSILWIAAA